MSLLNSKADGHNNLSPADRNWLNFLLTVYLLSDKMYAHCGDYWDVKRQQSQHLIQRDYNIFDIDSYLQLLTWQHSDTIKRMLCRLANEKCCWWSEGDAEQLFPDYFNK